MESSRPAGGRRPKNASLGDGRLLCDVCGAPAYEARCKIICRRCGYTRDCSDP
ncbi:MAG TPA: hypothetical protein HA326_09040 [Thermoplasmata archaeon]|nr:hypothetical protein [Thermoplasmata archaeon]